LPSFWKGTQANELDPTLWKPGIPKTPKRANAGPLRRQFALHGGASGSGGPPGEWNGQYRHGERTKAAIAERQKFSALLKMLRAGLT